MTAPNLKSPTAIYGKTARYAVGSGLATAISGVPSGNSV